MTTVVIGVDPGPSTGIVELICDSGQFEIGSVVQCNANAVLSIVDMLAFGSNRSPLRDPSRVLVAVEHFVVGYRAGRSSTAVAGQTTRELIADLQALGRASVRVVLRSASEVKPWGTDHRLMQAGLWDATKGMQHARDGARHALFAAVHDCGVPDPLSRRAIRS